MKILHVIFSFATGGSETMLVDIINEQSKTQSVELIVVNDVVNLNLIKNINSKVQIHYLNRKPGSRNPFPIMVLNCKIFKIKPAVIHFHNHNGINLIKHKTRAITCLTVHNLDAPIDYLAKYQKIFSISKAVQKDIINRGDINSILIYNGVNFDYIEKANNSVLSEKFKIIQVSRLDHELKGQDILIKAIQVLVKEKGIDNIQLNLIGEGKSLEYLKNLVKELSLGRHVKFLGIKDRLSIYKDLKNYQLLVQPSLLEGFGLTVVEGMAAKIPVLISNIDGPMEIIDNGKYGFYFRSGDVIDCSFQILKTINTIKNGDITEKLEQIYLYAKDNFDVKKTAENYINNY